MAERRPSPTSNSIIESIHGVVGSGISCSWVLTGISIAFMGEMIKVLYNHSICLRSIVLILQLSDLTFTAFNHCS